MSKSGPGGNCLLSEWWFNAMATSVKEIEQLMGMYLQMGIVQMLGVRCYWERDMDRWRM